MFDDRRPASGDQQLTTSTMTSPPVLLLWRRPYPPIGLFLAIQWAERSTDILVRGDSAWRELKLGVEYFID